MTIKLYMDHHVPRAITLGLLLRDIDVWTAYQDQTHTLADADLLERATELERVLFTQDDDFLVEATRRQAIGQSFHGIIYAHQRLVSIGRCIEDLALIANVAQDQELINHVLFLPL